MNIYLQGRKITTAQDHQRPSVEVLHLIRKLRWIGMEEEAELAEMQFGRRCHDGHARDRLGARYQLQQMDISSSQMALLAVLLMGKQRSGL